MIKLQISLHWPGCAQGKYIIKAKGFILAELRWGNSDGPLENWSLFAYVPIDPAGNGTFYYSGKRGIPTEATHVWAHCFTHDFSSTEDVSVEIPERFILPGAEGDRVERFSVLTDLHLSAKTWKISRALQSVEQNTVLLIGDSANDGLSEQFELFQKSIEAAASEKTIFPVTGNHDILHSSREGSDDGRRNYNEFQRNLLEKAARNGHVVSFAPDGRAYSLQIGEVDIIGLQCVTTKRQFKFPEEMEIDWMEDHLEDSTAVWHVIMCHAPLLAHNPNRNEGQPYLHLDKRIQEIVDQRGYIIFLNGHTHASPNRSEGNAEFDEKRCNVYLDCGSVVTTDVSGETGLMSPDWNDGCKTEIAISKNQVEICMSSIESGIRFPRGYYRFIVPFSTNL